jgi:hypothetical protein
VIDPVCCQPTLASQISRCGLARTPAIEPGWLVLLVNDRIAMPPLARPNRCLRQPIRPRQPRDRTHPIHARDLPSAGPPNPRLADRHRQRQRQRQRNLAASNPFALGYAARHRKENGRAAQWNISCATATVDDGRLPRSSTGKTRLAPAPAEDFRPDPDGGSGQAPRRYDRRAGPSVLTLWLEEIRLWGPASHARLAARALTRARSGRGNLARVVQRPALHLNECPILVDV